DDKSGKKSNKIELIDDDGEVIEEEEDEVEEKTEKQEEEVVERDEEYEAAIDRALFGDTREITDEELQKFGRVVMQIDSAHRKYDKQLAAAENMETEELAKLYEKIGADT